MAAKPFPKQTYKVTVDRTEVRSHTFSVTADDPDVAEELAIELSWDHDFSEDDAGCCSKKFLLTCS